MRVNVTTLPRRHAVVRVARALAMVAMNLGGRRLGFIHYY